MEDLFDVGTIYCSERQDFLGIQLNATMLMADLVLMLLQETNAFVIMLQHYRGKSVLLKCVEEESLQSLVGKKVSPKKIA